MVEMRRFTQTPAEDCYPPSPQASARATIPGGPEDGDAGARRCSCDTWRTSDKESETGRQE